MSSRCGHQRQGRDGSNNYVNRVVCRDCGKLLFIHLYRDCDESLVVLADKDGKRLTGNAFMERAQTTTSSSISAPPMVTIREVPVPQVVWIPAEPKYPEKIVEVPVFTTVERIVEVPTVTEWIKIEYIDREKLVEVPRIIMKVKRIEVPTVEYIEIEIGRAHV